MTVGHRSHPNQAQSVANTMQYFANIPGQSAHGKSPYNNNKFDEQTVPHALYQSPENTYKDMQPDYQVDPLAYNSQNYYSQNYSYNTNFMAYPMFQPINYDTTSALLGNEHLAQRQNSIPNGSLEQFLDNSSFDYEQVLQNLDLTQYENPESFCLEDYADLEQVNEGMNFDVAVKQEKADGDNTDGKNLEEMENVLNNNILSTNNPMINVVSSDLPLGNVRDNTVNLANDQTLDEQNLMEILELYSSPNSVEWQSQSNYLPNQIPVSGETVVKAEPNTNTHNSCDFVLDASPLSNSTEEGLQSIGVPDEELIQMPVSRFNELILSLTPELSNLAKDVRRRGKNKQAARLCRKRKIDNISSLEDTLSQLQKQKSKLLEERREIVAETEEIKSSIDMICEMLMKGLNEQNIGSELSLLHHSNGQTLLVQK
ncbi:nuclear factor erythroid 2-related factor 3-like [Dendronephthya gigantea]|uniref:nuclear factor erythroid 2-related factor 3-like n=1 Tax=Dendronephthya gigantea TaxID=151771 RepID=UPI00106ABFE2|nr:nuclear factor erythroid 2-related factor 3-like [Dendronephthya gigantea]